MPTKHLMTGAKTLCGLPGRDVSDAVTLRPDQVSCDACNARIDRHPVDAVVREAERITATHALTPPRPCPNPARHGPHLWRPAGARPLMLDRRCPGQPA